MQIPHKALPHIRLAVLAAFFTVCALVFGYLWVHSGGRLPVVSDDGYVVSLDMPHVSNLVPDSDVMIAGVKVGKIADVGVRGNDAHVTMRLSSNAPLHAGATVTVRDKTLVQETFLEVKDGTGPAMRSGASLPSSAAQPVTDLNAILASLSPATLTALHGVLNDLGATTAGTRDSISAALSGLGDLAGTGKDVLDALAAQSHDLRELSANAASLTDALNARDGEIATIVSSTNALTGATAGQAADLKAAMHDLPDLLTTATDAGSSLTALAHNLAPVAADLKAAAPDLSAAIALLPSTSSNLRGLLPSLDSVLKSAPATLHLVPQVAENLDHLIPSLRVDLSDVNPMLGYLEPYGHDVAAFFTNFAQSLAVSNADGHILQLMLIVDEQSFKGLPINTNVGILDKHNPYPAAGSNTHPGPWNGSYPRVTREVAK
jgi:phospholipid/cholesterol/gamma-HCH transport system substrate-binding protein